MLAKLRISNEKIEFENFEYLNEVVTFWLRDKDFVIFNNSHLEGENKIVITRDADGHITDKQLAQTISKRYAKGNNEIFMDYGCALNLDMLYYQTEEITEG